MDIANYTNWAHDRTYDKKKLAKDDMIMKEVIFHYEDSKGLKSKYLQVILYQYFFADPRERLKDKPFWVSRVINSKSEDYIPSPWPLYIDIILPNNMDK